MTAAAADESPPICPSLDVMNFEGGLRSGRPPAEPNADTVFIENCLDKISWLTYPPLCLVYSVSPSAPPERLKTEAGFPSGLVLVFSFCRYHSALSPESSFCDAITSVWSICPAADITLGGSTRCFVSFTEFSLGYLGYRRGFPDFDFGFSILKLNLNENNKNYIKIT